jgi:hypothetical protein
MKQLVSGVGGAVGGWASARLARRRFGDRTEVVAAMTLVPVALIYPLARRSFDDHPAVAREAAGVLAMGALAAVAARSPATRPLAVGGWLAHAAFDFAHDRGPGSRLPDWYPAACAGYDTAYAVALLR